MKQIKKLICNIRPDRFYLAVPVNPEEDDRFFAYETRKYPNDDYESYIRYEVTKSMDIYSPNDETHHDCLWDWIDDISESFREDSDGIIWNVFEFRTKKGLQRHLNKYKMMRELTE